MFTKQKYRLLKKELLIPNTYGWNSGKRLGVYRIQALRSIPSRGIKKGDVGGYVSGPDTLSQEGTCWIGYHASALGNVQVLNDAYIGDRAIALCDFSKAVLVIQDSVRLLDDARVTVARHTDDTDEPKMVSRLSGNASVFNNARVSSVSFLGGNTRVFENAQIRFADKILGDIAIRGKAQIQKGVNITGKCSVYGNAIIGEGATLSDCSVYGEAQIGENQKITKGEFHEEGIFINPTKEIPKIVIGEPVSLKKSKPANGEVKTKTEKALELLEVVQRDIASYETDIVKIIKYPVMTDRTDVNTMKMVKLLKKAERLSESPEDPDFEQTVSDLEDAFLAAESNALKLASTLLSEADKKKTEKAKDLLAIAADEGSSENEKKVSFKQAFKNLEGVIAVPEIAVDTFRRKIGLQEIEM